MSEPKEEKVEFGTRDRWLMFAVILGPMAAFTNQTVAYTLVPSACAGGSKFILHVTTIAFLALSLVAAMIGWRYHSLFAGEQVVPSRERTRWMAVVAITLGVFSAVVILAMEIPNWILGSCD
jgi:hypothetical protein